MAHSPARSMRSTSHGVGGGADAGRTGGGGGRPLDYQRVIKLFTNKHTEALVDRQVSAALRVARKNQEGFFIKDLPDLEELIRLIAGRVEAGMDVFRQPLASLVVLCGKPFRRSKSHEEFRRMDVVVSFVKAVADLLSISDTPLQVGVAQALRQIMRGYLPQGERRRDDAAWKYNQEIATKANVADMVVARLAAEIDDLMSYDADGDRKVDAEEYHNYAVDNDANRGNDEEAYNEAKAADAVVEGRVVRPPYLLGLLVKLVWELSAHGPNSRQLVLQGAPQLLMQLLGVVTDHREEAVFLSVEALWNMLEHSKEDLAQGEICISLSALLKKHRAANAAFLLGNEQSVVTITSIFERLLLFGFKKADKELRNEVLVVATLVAERKASVPLFVNSGFLGLVLEYAVAAEMELPVDANPRNFATSDPVDLEFKQLAWSLIGAMAAADDATMRRVQESLFVQTLLLYLDPSRAHGNRYLQIWAPTQRRALDLLAARLLLQLAPSCADQFNQYNGVVVALNHVRAHSSVLATPSGDSDAEGDGATQLGDDESMDAPLITDTEDDVDRQYGALCLLQATCTTGEIRTLLGESGAVEDLLTLLSGINAAVPPPAEVAPTATVTAATATPSAVSAGIVVEAVFGVLSMLCSEGHEDNQTRFRRAGGVGVLLSWLRYDPEDAVAKPMAVVPVVATLWEAVVGNRRSEAKFIVEDGVIAVLDLLDVCPDLARGQVIGCLADLVANPRAHPYVQSWRSDSSGKDAAVVLLSLWDAEEERLGVPRGTSGTIADPTRPLGKAVPDGSGASSATPRSAGAGTGAGAGSGGGASPGGFGRTGGSGSPRTDAPPAFERLRRALKASKLWTKVGGEEPGSALRAVAAETDLRPKIFSVLSALGSAFITESWEEGQSSIYDTLSWQHKLAYCVARRYFQFREGHLWLDLSDEMAAARVNLIKADLLQVEKELDASYNEAMAAQVEQHEVVCEQEDNAAADDERFFDTVRLQKAGEEAAYLLQQSQNPVARARARQARSRLA